MLRHSALLLASTSAGWAETGFRITPRGRIWGCWWMSSVWLCNVPLQPKKPMAPWAAPEETWAAEREESSASLSWEPTCSSASSSGVPSRGRIWTCWRRSRKVYKDHQRAPLLWRQRDSWVIQPGAKKVQRWPSLWPWVHKGELQDSWRGTFHLGI